LFRRRVGSAERPRKGIRDSASAVIAHLQPFNLPVESTRYGPVAEKNLVNQRVEGPLKTADGALSRPPKRNAITVGGSTTWPRFEHPH